MSRTVARTTYTLALAIGFALVRSPMGLSQPAELPGTYQIAVNPGYPQPAVWRVNTATGQLSFCSAIGTWRCIDVPNLPLAAQGPK
jgi:hypothetical protein